MDFRRILVMIAVGMLVLTVLAALSAPREEADEAPEPAAPERPAVPPETLSLRHPAPENPPLLRVRRRARVVLTVTSSVPGQVEIAGLGLLRPVDPAAPATFDVLATRPGRYEVVLLPTAGDRARLGTVVVG